MFILWIFGPLSNLSDGTLGINGFGGVFSWPLGYGIIRVQMEGDLGYNKDQVALVIPDSTDFRSWVLVTLGMPTINWIINILKGSEIDELSVSLNESRIAQLFGLLASRTFDSEVICCKPNCRPSWLEWGNQNKNEARRGCFFVQNNTWPNKTLLLGTSMHVMTQFLKKGWWIPTCLMASVWWTCILKLWW